MIIHTVSRGESVYRIAQKYDVSVQEIAEANQLNNPSRITIGQALVIPVDYIRYSVKSGETLYLLARRYGTTVSQILSVNPDITNPSKIYAGQSIIIPMSEGALRTIDVNGYAFPSISDEILNNSLEYLTFLSIFSYQVRENGMLVPIQDDKIINAAKNQNVLPFMVITNIGESGGFNSELISIILNDESIQETLINSILYVLEQNGYLGLDVDFEYIYPSDRENYNIFLRKLVERLRPLGYQLSSALAPKVSGNQQGLLYEAHDYPIHGQIMDHVIIMTYEWGYTYGPPQAVAPINQVERVLRYATSVIPSEKILMGMPNYGYDWTLPYVQGSAARALSNLTAVNLAINVGAEIKYDIKAQAPYFNYYDSNGRQHIVWFDDARSIKARLKLVDKYNLGGISYWTINSFFKTNFIVLSSLYGINKVL